VSCRSVNAEGLSNTADKKSLDWGA